jgi:hypothetical protein
MKIHLSRRRILLIVIVMVIVLGLGLLLRDFVRQNIVNPMVDLGWLIWVQMQTVPQVVYWALFMLLAISVAGRSLTIRPGRISLPGGSQTTNYTSSRYHHWQVGLEAVPHSPFSRERVERELQTLVLQVLAEQQRVDFEEVRTRQMRGELDLSAEGPAIQSLFVGMGHMGYPELPPLIVRLWARLLGRPLPQMAGLPPLDIDGIIAWLETQTGSGNSEKI